MLFSVIRGSMPRVGDRVMVEATFNPNMPFKWNAHRVQLLGDSGPAPSESMFHHAMIKKRVLLL